MNPGEYQSSVSYEQSLQEGIFQKYKDDKDFLGPQARKWGLGLVNRDSWSRSLRGGGVHCTTPYLIFGLLG